jgi:superfamily II RNA helicase
MFDTQMEPAVARDMIKGAADPLMSAFSLRYSQLLQLTRTEGSSPEMMLRVRDTQTVLLPLPSCVCFLYLEVPQI